LFLDTPDFTFPSAKDRLDDLGMRVASDAMAIYIEVYESLRAEYRSRLPATNKYGLPVVNAPESFELFKVPHNWRPKSMPGCSRNVTPSNLNALG